MPSGQPITLIEVRSEEQPGGALWSRWRFVMPGIGGPQDFDAVAADFEHLCRTYALPQHEASGPVPAGIIISFAAQPLDFGTTAPDVPQFFEAFRVENGVCIWEGF